jgi:hypothetical protein
MKRTQTVIKTSGRSAIERLQDGFSTPLVWNRNYDFPPRGRFYPEAGGESKGVTKLLGGRKAAKAGKIPALRVDKEYRFDPTAVRILQPLIASRQKDNFRTPPLRESM